MDLRPFTRRAFTLVEVLIVVTLVAIAAMIVLPTSASDARARVRAAARLLVADIEFAELSSLGRAADPCIIVFDTGSGTWHVALTSDPATPLDDPVTGDAYALTLGSGRAAHLTNVSIDALVVGGDDELAFDHLGVPDQATDATITLRCGTETIQVIVDATTGEVSAP